MKKLIFTCAFCVITCTNLFIYAQTVSLEDAIISAGKSVEGNLKTGTKIAVLNFNSGTTAFSEYVIEELMDNFTNGKNLVVVERAKLDIIRKEMDLQLSGDVSDESAQLIGRQLGAQSVISGSLTDTGSVFRLRVYAINVESVAREASSSVNINRNDPQVRFLLTGKTETDGTEISAAATLPDSKPGAVSVASYAIGDTGPAGGIIFYNKGSFSGGWQYLEAAPVEIEFSAKWGAYNKDVNTQTATGSGKKNTQLIAEQLNKDKESGMAAGHCVEIDFEGFKDWFIPSKDELDLLYKNLKLKKLGGFGNGKYLSSSQRGRGFVWVQNFSSGRQEDSPKNEAYAVRVIRSF